MPGPNPPEHLKLAEENPRFGNVSYNEATRADLEQIAQRAGVPHATQMSKPELAQALLERNQQRQQAR